MLKPAGSVKVFKKYAKDKYVSLRPVEQFLEGQRVAGLLCKESLETEISSLTRKLESAVEFWRIVKVKDLCLIFSLICRSGEIGRRDALKTRW